MGLLIVLWIYQLGVRVCSGAQWQYISTLYLSDYIQKYICPVPSVEDRPNTRTHAHTHPCARAFLYLVVSSNFCSVFNVLLFLHSSRSLQHFGFIVRNPQEKLTDSSSWKFAGENARHTTHTQYTHSNTSLTMVLVASVYNYVSVHLFIVLITHNFFFFKVIIFLNVSPKAQFNQFIRVWSPPKNSIFVAVQILIMDHSVSFPGREHKLSIPRGKPHPQRLDS